MILRRSLPIPEAVPAVVAGHRPRPPDGTGFRTAVKERIVRPAKGGVAR